MYSYVLYPEMLETIQIYIQFLNEADALIMTLDSQELRPGISKIPVVFDEIHIGDLVDEVGGAWAYEPKVIDKPDLKLA